MTQPRGPSVNRLGWRLPGHDRVRAAADSLRTGFWAVPAVCVVVAVGLGLGVVELDRRRTESLRFTFGAGPDGAREVLSAISTSMITFTGLVFSITIVVLQLTSSQFSPRVLRTFLRDRVSQLSLGVFVATFVYAMTVLRTVNSTDGSTFVPSIATTVGLALLLLSVAVFVAYIHHIATAIQVSSILTAIGDETRDGIERRYPADRGSPGRYVHPPEPDELAQVIATPRFGVIVRVDEERLVRLAAEHDVVLHTNRRPGDFVPEGAPLLQVVGDAEPPDVDALARCFTFSRERTMQQDVAFGFRQLVDIAERALSTGVNDPTTAVQVLDQLHDLLRRLATRPLRDGLHADDRGVVRLVTPSETFADYAHLALDEIDAYGKDSAQVADRLSELRRDVRSVARPEHRCSALDGQAQGA